MNSVLRGVPGDFGLNQTESQLEAVRDEQADPLTALRRWMRPRVARESCELCGAEIGPLHSHLFEPEHRKLSCACESCAILFSDRKAGKFRRVPRRIHYLADFQCSDTQWESLRMPIDLAFFFQSTPAGRVVALYPSPAGATEALPDERTWHELAAANPPLARIEPDVEAILANRVGKAREAYVCPIDECYALVGLVRLHWRGLSGGTRLWNEIEQFFSNLRQKAS